MHYKGFLRAGLERGWTDLEWRNEREAYTCAVATRKAKDGWFYPKRALGYPSFH